MQVVDLARRRAPRFIQRLVTACAAPAGPVRAGQLRDRSSSAGRSRMGSADPGQGLQPLGYVVLGGRPPVL